MPTYLPPRLGISQSVAYAEAAAFARAGEPVLLTSALSHPNIVGEDGLPMTIYTVNDYEPLVATLEAEAGGQTVTFQPVAMSITLPDEAADAPAGSVQETISNVTRELVPHLEAVIRSAEPVTQTLRTYLRSDTSAPHETPPLVVTLTNAVASADSITATAGFGDTTNRRFPRVEYTAQEFPCLAP